MKDLPKNLAFVKSFHFLNETITKLETRNLPLNEALEQVSLCEYKLQKSPFSAKMRLDSITILNGH